ncbi:branched-chain amino acid ABC transporter permease [uncultured Jatrophihabitans sp.]|uniref:branched-chain amino acid ABC transporter permease n=1 Tax=uncultured Jatrophihabitans sp. TaxID=1610747 RepID=UPI0035CA88CB
MTILVAKSPKRRRPIRLGDQVERVAKYAVLIGAAVWLIANLVKAPSQFFQNIETGIGNGALYALIALGYTLVYGIIELINFAHGDLFMLGTVLAANMMVNWLHLTTPTVTAFLGLVLTMIVVMIFCALINMGAEFFAYRRLRNAPKLAPLITAVGLSFIFQNIGQLVNGSGQPLWDTIFTQSGFTIGGVKVLWSFIVVLIATGLLLLGLTFVVQNTLQGKAMRATAQDQDAARLMGINVNRTISFTFGLGGAMAGAGAVLYLETVGHTRYDDGLTLGLFAFTAAVLGGIGNLLGAVLGALLIGVIQALNDGSPYAIGAQWSKALIFAILILVLVFKPEGLLGQRTTEKV